MRFMTEYIDAETSESEPEWLVEEVAQAARETAQVCDNHEDAAYFRRLADTVGRKPAESPNPLKLPTASRAWRSVR